MKKLLLILLTIFLMSGTWSFAQDVSPLPSVTVKKLIAPNTPVFYYNTVDSAFWVFKGETGWLRIASNSQLQRYFVPYDNANRNVNLGSKNITSTQQNLPINIGVVVMPDHIKNGNGTITLGSNGVFRFAKNTDGINGIIQLSIGTTTTITLTDGVVNFVYADYGSGTPTYMVTLDNQIFKDNFTKIPVIRATREGNTVHFEEYDLYGLLLANKLMIKDIYLRGGERLSGLVLSTAATRISTVSDGRCVFAVQYYDNMAANIAGSSGLLYEYYLTSGIWNKSLVTSYDASYYSDGTNRQALNNNKWVAKYMWRDVGDDNEVYYIHGNQYNSQAEAVNELVPIAPSVMTAHSIYVGKIVIQKDALNGIALPRIWEGAVQTTGVSNHYDLSGSSLVWNVSGHTGTANTLASFDSGGIATNTTTGNLSETITGLEFSSTRQVIGGSTTLTLTSGHVIPTTDNISHAEIAYTHSQNDADLSATNEIQTLSTDGSPGNITLSNSGGTININVNDADASTVNELNSSMVFDNGNRILSLTDAGGTKTVTIPQGDIVNCFINTFTPVSTDISVTWPSNFADTNYDLEVRHNWVKTVNGRIITVSGAIYDFNKTISGFSCKIDTLVGYISYRAVNSSNLYPITISNYLPKAGGSMDNTNLVTNMNAEYLNGQNSSYYATASSLSSYVPTSRTISINGISYDLSANRSWTINSMVYPSEGIPISTGSAWGTSIADNSSNWNTAYTDRLKWDGGSTGLTAATGRTSLGGTTIGQAVFTLTNPSAITFPRFNVDNTVTALSASDFRTAIGAGTGNGTMTSVVNDTSPNLGGNLIVNQKNIDITATLSANSSYSGIIETGTVGETVAFGDVLYLKFSDGKWWKAKADSYSTTPAMRMAMASISANASGVLLIEGNVRYDSWSLAANKIYLSAATSGAITTTQPSTTGNQIQVIGIAKTSTTMYFKPSNDVGEK